jgi:hypothetical protein
MLAILAAVMIAAAPQWDTVFTADGGRIVGTVIEETAQSVALKLPDGSFRRLQRRDVVRVEYADGTISQRSAAPPAAAPAAPPPAATPPPPPAYTPPPPPAYPPPYAGRPPPPLTPAPTGPASPLWGALGIGGMFFSGDVEPGVSAGRIFDPQLDLALEGGLRLTPHLGLGLYLDVGVGGAGSEVDAYCNANFLDCTSETVRFGVLLRHTFEPAARVTPWVAVGTGYAYGHVTSAANGYGPSFDVVQYSGWEMARLMVGVDVRSNPVVGFGFYGGTALTSYSRFENTAGSTSLPSTSVHAMFQAGIRLTLFP